MGLSWAYIILREWPAPARFPVSPLSRGGLVVFMHGAPPSTRTGQSTPTEISMGCWEGKDRLKSALVGKEATPASALVGAQLAGGGESSKGTPLARAAGTDHSCQRGRQRWAMRLGADPPPWLRAPCLSKAWLPVPQPSH